MGYTSASHSNHAPFPTNCVMTWATTTAMATSTRIEHAPPASFPLQTVTMVRHKHVTLGNVMMGALNVPLICKATGNVSDKHFPSQRPATVSTMTAMVESTISQNAPEAWSVKGGNASLPASPPPNCATALTTTATARSMTSCPSHATLDGMGSAALASPPARKGRRCANLSAPRRMSGATSAPRIRPCRTRAAMGGWVKAAAVRQGKPSPATTARPKPSTWARAALAPPAASTTAPTLGPARGRFCPPPRSATASTTTATAASTNSSRRATRPSLHTQGGMQR